MRVRLSSLLQYQYIATAPATGRPLNKLILFLITYSRVQLNGVFPVRRRMVAKRCPDTEVEYFRLTQGGVKRGR